MEIPTAGSVSHLFILLAVAVFGLVVGKFYIARKSIWERQEKGLVTDSIQLLPSMLLTTSPQACGSWSLLSLWTSPFFQKSLGPAPAQCSLPERSRRHRPRVFPT